MEQTQADTRDVKVVAVFSRYGPDFKYIKEKLKTLGYRWDKEYGVWWKWTRMCDLDIDRRNSPCPLERFEKYFPNANQGTRPGGKPHV